MSGQFVIWWRSWRLRAEGSAHLLQPSAGRGNPHAARTSVQERIEERNNYLESFYE